MSVPAPKEGIYHPTPLVQALGSSDVLMRLNAKRAETARTLTSVTAAAAPAMAAAAPNLQAAPAADKYFRIFPMNSQIPLDENILRTGTLIQVLNELNPLKFVIGALVLQVKEYIELAKALGNSYDLDKLIGEVNRVFIQLEINKHILSCVKVLTARISLISDSIQTRKFLIKEIESRWTHGNRETHGIEYHQDCLKKLIVAPKGPSSMLTWIPGAAYVASVAASWYYPEVSGVVDLEVSLTPQTNYTEALSKHLEEIAALREDLLITHSYALSIRNSSNPAIYQFHKKKYDELEKAELLLKKEGAPLAQLKIDSNAEESSDFKKRKSTNEVASIEAKWKTIETYKQEIDKTLQLQRIRIKMTDELLQGVESKQFDPSVTESNALLKQLVGLEERIKTDKRNHTTEQAELQAFYKYYNGKVTELNTKINEQKVKKGRMIEDLNKQNLEEETLHKFITHELYSFEDPRRLITSGFEIRDKWLELMNKQKLENKDGKASEVKPDAKSRG